MVVEKKNKLALQAIAIDIFGTYLRCNISLISRWPVPGDKNQTADVISELIDYDDWFVANEVFYLLDSLWGPYTVDRFADEQNTKLKGLTRYFGRQTVKQLVLSHRTGKVKITGLLLPPYF